MLDVQKIKADFPILGRRVNEHDLVYLDNAATTQKPLQVLNAVDDYYKTCNANVHRGSHTLADEATSLYEKSRETVARFLGAQKSEEIIFVRNTTEAINLVAYAYAQKHLQTGDEILLGIWEHHSNLVPWQQVCLKTGARLVYMYPTKEGLFDFNAYKAKLNKRTKLVAATQASNVLGTIFPVTEIVSEAKKFGAVTVIDGAQSTPHMSVNVKSMGCDFFAFSGHKMLAPMGIGALYVKLDMLDKLDPFMTGGAMILEVDEQNATWENPPYKFEAGTPNVSGAVGLARAIQYLQEIGMGNIRNHEIEVTKYALEFFNKARIAAPALNILGPIDPTQRTGLISFYYNGLHPHDVSAILDQQGVAIRSGFHCAMPLHLKLGIGPTCRASWYLYNDKKDIDALMEGVLEASRLLL
ncbi:MAG: SufS family cysteine desulfurase [Patescibacteria group bacterium]